MHCIKLPIKMYMYIESGCLSCIAVAVPLVVVSLIVCAGVVFITAIVAYTLKRKNRVNNKTNGTNG